MIKKYVKKPIVIEAIQWDATKKTWDEILSMGLKWRGGEMGTDTFKIVTLEGAMTASVGDYIIKGIAGEFYPVKPNIFKQLYTEVKK